MDKKIKVNIGLDIGITSVGWSILDEDNNILKLGVRLFDDVANEKDGKLDNVQRRECRTQRRRIRRARTRKQAYLNYLVSQNWFNSYDEAVEFITNFDLIKFGYDNPIELRIQALENKISKDELIFLLFHYLHHRGYLYITESDADKLNENDENKKEFPSLKIYKFYKNYEYYKGSIVSDNSAYDFANEIRQILNIQGIDENFANYYINELFLKHRDYSQGPGSEKSPTPYGMWYWDDKEQKVTKREGDSLWDSLVGKCSYYPDEKRGLAKSPIAEIFNLLNDISNIYFINNSNIKLTEDERNKIFSQYNNSLLKTKSFNLTPKELLKILQLKCQDQNIDESDIYGYRVDGDNKKIITELKNYCQIIRWAKEYLVNKDEINLFNLEILNFANNIFVELSKTQDLKKRLEILKNIKSKLLNENKFTNIDSDKSYNLDIKLIKGLKGLTKTHTLSYKAMEEFIKFSLSNGSENLNWMRYSNFNKNLNNTNQKKSSKYLKKIDREEVISPTTRRAFNQTINVLNKILKLYSNEYEIKNITVEVARDKNSCEERKVITSSQNKNRKEVEEILKNIGNKKFEDLNAAQILRIKLWNRQRQFDIYDSKLGENESKISFDDVINGNKLDIDHIIPYSISQDDSINNKVLTRRENNQVDKKQQTPYQFFSQLGKWDDYKEKIEKFFSDKLKEKWIKNLLYIGNPLTDIDSFVGRNLSDTRYASRLVLNVLQEFFKNNKNYGNTKIKVIRGGITNFARYNLFTNGAGKSLIPKNRDIYCHHAIDASIVSYLGSNHNIKLLLNHAQQEYNDLKKKNNFEIDEDKRLVNKETGEVIESWYAKNGESRLFAEQLKQYNTIYNKSEGCLIPGSKSNEIKFSRMYINKNNVQLSNETIYSFRFKKDENGNQLDDGIIIDYIKVLESKTSDLEKYFIDEKIQEKDLEKLLCYKKNPKLYNKLKMIFNRYYKSGDNTNPFIRYMEEECKIEKPKWIQVGNLRINKLRLIGETKNSNSVIILNKHNKKAIYKSLKFLFLRIYKDNNDKYRLIGINQKVLTYDKKKSQLKIDKNKLDKVLELNNIFNSEKYIDIKRGMIFVRKEDNKLFWSIGGGTLSQNKLELKSINTSNEISNLGKQFQRSLSTIVAEYDIAQVDELGNIYNRRKIEL